MKSQDCKHFLTVLAHTVIPVLSPVFPFHAPARISCLCGFVFPHMPLSFPLLPAPLSPNKDLMPHTSHPPASANAAYFMSCSSYWASGEFSSFVSLAAPHSAGSVSYFVEFEMGYKKLVGSCLSIHFVLWYHSGFFSPSVRYI